MRLSEVSAGDDEGDGFKHDDIKITTGKLESPGQIQSHNLGVRVWTGSIDLSHNKLVNLKGSPRRVVGDCDVSYNALTTLEGSPEVVSRSFDVHDNKLASLKGGPRVAADYTCARNRLRSLEGAPQEVESTFSCDENSLVMSLKGGPRKVGRHYMASGCQIASLEGFPEHVGEHFELFGNKLTSLSGIHKHLKFCQEIDLRSNPLRSSILGLLLIEGLQSFRIDIGATPFLDEAADIMDKYLHMKEGESGRSLLVRCQGELIDAGLDEYARL